MKNVNIFFMIILLSLGLISCDSHVNYTEDIDGHHILFSLPKKYKRLDCNYNKSTTNYHNIYGNDGCVYNAKYAFISDSIRKNFFCIMPYVVGVDDFSFEYLIDRFNCEFPFNKGLYETKEYELSNGNKKYVFFYIIPYKSCLENQDVGLEILFCSNVSVDTKDHDRFEFVLYSIEPSYEFDINEKLSILKSIDVQ